MRKRQYNTSIASSASRKYFLQPYKKIMESALEDDSSMPDDSSSQDDLSMLESLIQDDGRSLPTDQAYIVDFKLSEDRYMFEMTKNSHAALNVFVNCVEKGFYPPKEILVFLSEKLKMYISGEMSLDSTIGLGKRSYSVDRRNIDIVTEIDKLIHYFKLNISDAVEAVTSRYNEIGIELKDTTVQDIYNRDGKKKLENSLMFNHNDIKWLDAMSKEFRNQKLKELFDTYPENVKAYMKKKYTLPFL